MKKGAMKTELYKLKKSMKITDIKNTDDKVSFIYKKKELSLESYHDQDCCENVYADFSVMKYYKDSLIGKKVREFTIKGVKDIGFLMCFDIGSDEYDYKWVKIFIACYNSQNGYYSDELKLIIKDNEDKKEIDISKFVEDDIN